MEDTKNNSEQNTDPTPETYEKYLRDDSWKEYLPHNGFLFTPILIILNILVFIIMAINGMNVMDPDGDVMILWGSNFTPLTLNGEFWRLLTAGFLHFGIFHLLMNMYGLLLIGSLLEPILGSLRFFIAYILCLLGGSVLSLWWHEYANAAGASGAVFGMYGVFISLLLTNLLEKSERKELLMRMLFVVGFNLLYGLQGNIDNAGHIGGLITGILVGFSLFPSLVNKENMILNYSSIFATSLAIIVSSLLIVQSIPNSFPKYDSLMEKFTNNETAALGIFKNQEATVMPKKFRTQDYQNGMKI